MKNNMFFLLLWSNVHWWILQENECKAQCLDHFSSPSTSRIYDSETWLFLSLLHWWHTTLPLIPAWLSSSCCSHLSLPDRHFWQDEGPLPSTKTELLVVPGNPTLHHNFSIQLSSTSITPSRSSRNLGVVMVDQLNFARTTLLEQHCPADLPSTTLKGYSTFFGNDVC